MPEPTLTELRNAAQDVLDGLTDDHEDCHVCDHMDDDGEYLPDDVLHNPARSCGRLQTLIARIDHPDGHLTPAELAEKAELETRLTATGGRLGLEDADRLDVLRALAHENDADEFPDAHVAAARIRSTRG